MTDELEPATEAAASLVPPGRLPPTAVGIVTPPPPGRPGAEDYGDRTPMVARIGQGLLGSMLLAGGIAVYPLSSLAAVIGIGMSVTGVDVVCRAVRQEGMVSWVAHGLGRRRPPAPRPPRR